MDKVLILASVASMIDQFNMQNIAILQEQGYEVHVAANFEQGSSTSKERVENFKRELKEKNISYFQIDFSRNVLNIQQNLKAYKQIKQILIKNKYKFIHCHSPIGGACGRLAAKSTKTKVIYTAHGFHFYKGSPKLNWIIYYPIEKILSYITDVLITINKEDYDLAIKKMKSKSIEYIPGIGIDTEKFKNIKLDKNNKRDELNIPKDSTLLLSVGELNKNKNHEVIIKSLAHINDKKIHYCIAGKGELDSYLIDLAKTLEVNDNIHLLGFRNDIHELYKASDIFCFPSYREGLSVAMMESMASGMPVICSSIRGNVDLIESEMGGYLCNPSSEIEFSRNISNIVNDKEMLYNMGRYNEKSIERFDKNIVINQMHTIYENIR